jgi:hypothetical protein
MAALNPNSTPTLPGNGTPTDAPKRKSARKTQASRTAPKRAAAARPEEILFEELPNPLRTPQPPYVWIDFPTEGERLSAPTYVIRLGAGGADSVELSINKGPWRHCRLTSGYWWYDWADIPRGKHTLVARIHTPQGAWYRTPPRKLHY